MRHISILGLSVFLSMAVFLQEISGAEIKGTITNNSAEFIVIGESKLPLTKEGSFAYKMKIDKGAFLTIRYQGKEIEVFVEPDEQMEISFDAQAIDKSIHFTGASPETNLFLFNKIKLDEQISRHFDQRNESSKKLFSLDEDHFLQEMDSLKNDYKKPLADLLKSNKGINPDFIFEMEHRISFLFDRYIMYYPQEHMRITGKKISDVNIVAYSVKRKAFFDSIKLDDPKLIGVRGYTEFGNEYLEYLTYYKACNKPEREKDIGKSDNLILEISLDLIDQLFKNSTVRDYWRFQTLYTYMNNNGVKNIGKFVESFNQTSSSESFKNQINTYYQKELKKRQGHLVKTYKTIDGFHLEAHIFLPEDLQKGEKRPALVQFHGGGWTEGAPDWCFGRSEFGFVNICIEYRTFNHYGVFPFEQISDSKSAIRWVRKNADELHIDQDKIIAEGISVGGHLALCTALLDIPDEPNENRFVSSVPNAVVSISAPYDITEWIWFEEFVADKDRIRGISPNQNIKKGLPPILVFHGTEDFANAPYRHCETFVKKMKEMGNEIYFYPIKGQEHFMWWSDTFKQVAEKAKRDFYTKLGYL